MEEPEIFVPKTQKKTLRFSFAVKTALGGTLAGGLGVLAPTLVRDGATLSPLVFAPGFALAVAAGGLFAVIGAAQDDRDGKTARLVGPVCALGSLLVFLLGLATWWSQGVIEAPVFAAGPILIAMACHVVSALTPRIDDHRFRRAMVLGRPEPSPLDRPALPGEHPKALAAVGAALGLCLVGVVLTFVTPGENGKDIFLHFTVADREYEILFPLDQICGPNLDPACLGREREAARGFRGLVLDAGFAACSAPKKPTEFGQCVMQVALNRKDFTSERMGRLLSDKAPARAIPKSSAKARPDAPVAPPSPVPLVAETAPSKSPEARGAMERRIEAPVNGTRPTAAPASPSVASATEIAALPAPTTTGPTSRAAKREAERRAAKEAADLKQAFIESTLALEGPRDAKRPATAFGPDKAVLLKNCRMVSGGRPAVKNEAAVDAYFEVLKRLGGNETRALFSEWTIPFKPVVLKSVRCRAGALRCLVDLPGEGEVWMERAALDCD